MIINRKKSRRKKSVKKKEAEKVQQQAQWEAFQGLAETGKFIVELVQVRDNSSGQVYSLSPRTNFIAVNGEKVVIQIGTNSFLATNGLGVLLLMEGSATIDIVLQRAKMVLYKSVSISHLIIHSEEIMFRSM